MFANNSPQLREYLPTYSPAPCEKKEKEHNLYLSVRSDILNAGKIVCKMSPALNK